MKTAVEWLIEQLHSGKELSTVIRQAKAMEKEQIIDAFQAGDDRVMAEEYYKETFIT